jgi:hypothetical protein
MIHTFLIVLKRIDQKRLPKTGGNEPWEHPCDLNLSSRIYRCGQNRKVSMFQSSMLWETLHFNRSKHGDQREFWPFPHDPDVINFILNPHRPNSSKWLQNTRILQSTNRSQLRFDPMSDLSLRISTGKLHEASRNLLRNGSWNPYSSDGCFFSS